MPPKQPPATQKAKALVRQRGEEETEARRRLPGLLSTLVQNWSDIVRITGPGGAHEQLGKRIRRYRLQLRALRRDFPGLGGYLDQQQGLWDDAAREVGNDAENFDRAAIITIGQRALARLAVMRRQITAFR